MFVKIPYPVLGSFFYTESFLSKYDIKLAILLLNAKSFYKKKFNPNKVTNKYLLKLKFSERYIYNGLNVTEKREKIQKHIDEFDKYYSELGKKINNTNKEKFIIENFKTKTNKIGQKTFFCIAISLFKKILEADLNKNQLLILFMMLRVSQNYKRISNLTNNFTKHRKITYILRLFNINITKEDIQKFIENNILEYYSKGIFMFNPEYIHYNPKKNLNWDKHIADTRDFFKKHFTDKDKSSNISNTLDNFLLDFDS